MNGHDSGSGYGPRARDTEGKRSIWVYLGCGCGSLVAIVMAVLIAITIYSYQKAEEFTESLRDPEARAAMVAESLGADELPEGYQPMGSFSIPFVMEMTMLSDLDLPAGETVENEVDAFERRGFILMKVRRFSSDQEKDLRAYFDGQARDAEFFDDTNIDFVPLETLRRGQVAAGNAEVLWVSELGAMRLTDERRDVIMTRLLATCAGDDSYLRIGMWFEALPEEVLAAARSRAEEAIDGAAAEAETVADEADAEATDSSAGPDGSDASESPADPVAETPPSLGSRLDLAGTPADPERIIDFLDHFDLCVE